MALSGVQPYAIAKILGNSVTMCERHYVAVQADDAGTRWPFRWD